MTGNQCLILFQLHSVRVPKYKREPACSVDLKQVDIEFDTMVFEQVMMLNRDLVWERTH